jgi:hypothetical protein
MLCGIVGGRHRIGDRRIDQKKLDRLGVRFFRRREEPAHLRDDGLRRSHLGVHPARRIGSLWGVDDNATSR